MKCEKSSKTWKKNLTVSLLLSVLLAVPVGTLTQDGQVYGSVAAAQERDKEMKAGGMLEEQMDAINQAKELLRAQYGVNKRITDGQYDRSLAVKFINGTFVGKKTENIIAYRGIPFVGKQPVGELRWKAPTEVVPTTAYMRRTIMRKAPTGMRTWRLVPCFIRVKTACI